MELEKLLNELIMPDSPDWNMSEIVEALASENQADGLRQVFGANFYPKVFRWLSEKLRSVVASKEWKEKKPNEFDAKLNTYLKAGTGRYEDNAKILAREIMRAYEDWKEYEIKKQDFTKSEI